MPETRFSQILNSMTCPAMRVRDGAGIWPFGDAMGAISGESPVVLSGQIPNSEEGGRDYTG